LNKLIVLLKLRFKRRRLTIGLLIRRAACFRPITLLIVKYI
jgi:hypothetical protein